MKARLSEQTLIPLEFYYRPTNMHPFDSMDVPLQHPHSPLDVIFYTEQEIKLALYNKLDGSVSELSFTVRLSGPLVRRPPTEEEIRYLHDLGITP